MVQSASSRRPWGNVKLSKDIFRQEMMVLLTWLSQTIMWEDPITYGFRKGLVSRL